MIKRWPVLILTILLFSPTLSHATDIKTVTNLQFNGSLSLNWRNIGPRCPGYEVQIQNQVYLADLFLGFNGLVKDSVPFLLEFQIPTAGQGRLQLHQFSTHFWYRDRVRLELGKFLIPFGRYNELYRPDQFVSLTRPLLYASPDSLDLVLRLNSPRPPFSSGYTDIGARISYHPHSSQFFIPTELTFYVVNGLGETTNRLRTFPYSGQLTVQPPPINGVHLDFGHLNNNLADNNNNKAPGARIAFALGDLRLPFPIDEKLLELQGVNIGISGMLGRYDLEEALTGQDYKIIGTDIVLQYKGINFTGEYIYSKTDFRLPQADASDNVNFSQEAGQLLSAIEINQGYYIQSIFPLWRHPSSSKRLLGILAFNRLKRRGPKLIFSENTDPSTRSRAIAFPTYKHQIITYLTKYTAGLNFQINKGLILKSEYSFWDIDVPKVGNNVQKDVYQTGFSLVVSF